MEKKIIKRDLLAAMQNIRNEYLNNEHCVVVYRCHLCKLYFSHWHCDDCPMNIFNPKNKNVYSCMQRRCVPFDSHDKVYKKKEKTAAVIEFYDKAIEVVKTKTTAQLNRKNAFQFLVDIDNEVADKHGLKMPRKKEIVESIN